MEGAIRRVDTRARRGGVGLDVRRTGRFTEPSIGPGRSRRHAELQQREEQ